jgi:hypothetical protein
MMPIIKRARVLCDDRGHRTFGIATDGMRISRLAMIALAYAILAIALAYAILASLARERGTDQRAISRKGQQKLTSKPLNPGE